MPIGRLILLYLLVLTAFPAVGAQVIGIGLNRKSIAITHDRVKYNVDDRVCVIQQRIEVVCGIVLKTTSKGAIVKLDTTFEALNIGDFVRRTGGGRMPAAQLLESVPAPRGPEKKILLLSAGVDIGPTFFFPVLHLQVAAFPKFAFGVQPLYFRGSTTDGSLSAFGGYATFSYYGSEYFTGLWLQGGLGIVSFSTTSTTGGSDESATSFAGFATVGYRGAWELGLNVGIAAGVQFIQDPSFVDLDVKASGVHPLLMLDVGMSF